MIKTDIQGGTLADFNRLISIPHVKAEYTHTKRCQDITYKYMGVIVAQKTRFFTRGKESFISIFIPNRNWTIEDYLKYRG